jgi:peroxiredoxin
MVMRMETARTPAVGDTAADFTLPDSDGNPRRLSDFTRDSACVLIFYRGHW